MLKNIPGVADFTTKIKILLLHSRGGPMRLRIMKALRDANTPLTNGQLSTCVGVSPTAIRLHIDTLIASEILIRTRPAEFGNMLFYSFSQITKAHLDEVDILIRTIAQPMIDINKLTWHDYGACCKACARGYDTPRYSEPCVSCKVARSNYVPK